MKINFDEVIERGLHVDKTGHITDPSGNEYREEGEACWLDEDDLRDLLTRYITYVEEYPEEHDESSYPACFNEWFDNDLKEGNWETI